MSLFNGIITAVNGTVSHEVGLNRFKIIPWPIIAGYNNVTITTIVVHYNDE